MTRHAPPAHPNTRVHLNTEKVVFVRVDKDEQKIGFGL